MIVTPMVWLDPTAINLANFNKDFFTPAILLATFPSVSARRIWGVSVVAVTSPPFFRPRFYRPGYRNSSTVRPIPTSGTGQRRSTCRTTTPRWLARCPWGTWRRKMELPCSITRVSRFCLTYLCFPRYKKNHNIAIIKDDGWLAHLKTQFTVKYNIQN